MIAQAKPSGWETWVLAGCLHFPLHDKAKWAAFLDLLRDVKPDGVGLLGDTIECAALSKYGNDEEIALDDEFNAEQECKAAVRAAAPNARLVETLGNHDLETRINRARKDIRSVVANRYKQVVTENQHWKRLDYVNHKDSVHWVGQVGFTHGYKLSKNGGRDECIEWGFDNCLLVRAHTHRPELVMECEINATTHLNRSYANVGTMTDMSDKANRYFRDLNTNRWGCAPLVVHVNAKRQRGFATRQWQAEQVIL